MTPVNLARHNSIELQQFGADSVDDSLSMDTQDIVDQPASSITEIAASIHAIIYILLNFHVNYHLLQILQVMNDQEAHFKYQAQFGRVYDEDDFLIFNVAIRYPETVVSVLNKLNKHEANIVNRDKLNPHGVICYSNFKILQFVRIRI